MPKPSVLHIYKDYYPPVLGGIEKAMHWMADQARDDYVVRVLVASRSRKFVDEDVDGVRVVRVACAGRLLSAPIAPGFLKWIKRLDSDILHFHMPNPTAELAWLMTKPPRGRVVVTYHSDIIRQKLTGLVYKPLQHRFLNHARLIMPTSQRYLETSETLQPHRQRCRVVPLGVPLDELRRSTPESEAYKKRIEEKLDGRVGIIFIGLLRYYKGLQFLIRAMREIAPEKAKLLIAGEVPDGRESEKQELVDLTKSLGLNDRVEFLGGLSDAEATGLRAAGHIFCLPSHLRSEAFGLTQIEAMAFGMPVIATDLPGVSEVNQHEQTGLIVPPGDVTALRDALARLIGDTNLRKQYGEAACSRAENTYSARVMGEHLKKAYNDVLSLPGRNISRKGSNDE
jgi:glycosyltransferase involved in cell wall biosynthesis